MSIIEEYNVIKHYRRDIYKVGDRESINKIYRQARVWNRFHYVYAAACTRERHLYLNQKFKNIRCEALKTLNI